MMKYEGKKSLWTQKEYLKMIVANLISRFGDAIDAIAFTWLVYELTGSATWSAIIFGVNRIPTVFLTPFVGPIVEGMNKKRVMITMDLVRAVCVGFLATTLILGVANQWILLILTLIISSAEAFRQPALSAFIPKILEKEYYEKGISFNASACSTIELIGTGLAGVIIALIGVSGAIYIDMLTFIGSALVILFIKSNEIIYKKEKLNFCTYKENLKSGFNYLKNNAVLRYFVCCAIFLNGIMVPFNALQAPLVSDILHTGESMLSVIGMSITLGMILGAAIYSKVEQCIGKKYICKVSIVALALYYFSFVLEGYFLKMPIMLYLIVSSVSFVFGCTVAWINCLINIEFMKCIEESYMARVYALMSAACTGIMPITSFALSAIIPFTSVEIIFISVGIFNLIIFPILCSKKRLSVFNKEEKEKVA